MTEKSDNVPAAASAVSTSEPGNVMDMVKQFDFLSIGLGGKIHCSLTNRDLPLRVDAVQQHLNSKKLKKEREWYNADYSKYEPLIVAHKTKPKMLFCTLTGIELNRIPGQVEAHINGKRFRNRKAEMEGLKQAERPSATPSSDDDEFWAPKAANTAGDGEMEEMSVDEGESDVEGEEGDEDDGGAAKRRPSRGGKANDSRKGPNNGKGKQKGQAVKSGKDGNTQTARAARANRDQENGSVSEGVRPKGKAGKSTVGRKKQTGKALPTHAAKNGEAEPLSNDTPAVLNAIKTAPVASTSAKKKTRHKAASPKGKGASKGNETPEGRVVGEATSVKAPRKHKVPQHADSGSKKRRKA